MKKIAIVSDAVYPFNKGGKEKRIYDITTRLAAQGYDVTIYCMQWWKSAGGAGAGDRGAGTAGKTIVRDGVTLHAISPYYPLYAGNRRSIKEAIFFAVHCLKMLWQPFDVIDVDHVPHLAIFTTKLVCFLKRKKMIVTWHEVWGQQYWESYLGKWKGRIAYAIERASVRLPNTILSVSEHTTNELRNLLQCKREIITIPNGLDVAIIKNSTPAKITSDIIFAGRLLAHKNVDVLLRATSILRRENPEISLLIVGNGPEEAALKVLVRDLDLQRNVLFVDFFEDHRELYGLMKSSKVFALPSIREGFGIMAIEANACGLPVVTIDHPHNAAKDLIVHNENGLLSALNATDLATAIGNALAARKSPDFYATYSAQYDYHNLIPRIAAAYGVDAVPQPAVAQRAVAARAEQPSFKASVIILTYNSAKTIKKVLDGAFGQKFENYEVICIDSSSTDATPNIIADYPARLITIDPADFGHGKTRNYAAQIAKGQFVVFLTHDSIPESEHWLAELLKPFDDPAVVGTYGRQVPRPEENILDKHFQLSLYANKPTVWERGNWKQGDNIFSDANSAVRRDVLLQYPYADGIIVSEDYEWAARVLKRGYKIVYSTTACVIHSHSYSLRDLFKRNFDVGVSYRSIYKRDASRYFISKGLVIVSQEIKYLYDSGHANLIPRAIVRDMVRFFGVQAGKCEWLFAKNFKRDHMSAQRWYWK